MNKNLARIIASALGMAAVLFVTTACYGLIGHQPEVPAELLKK